MSEPVILGFIVPSGDSVSIVSLDPTYSFEVNTDDEQTTVEIKINAEAQRAAIGLPIDSLTVVYGENGGGKTRLLLDVCSTLARERKLRPLGVIWRIDERLYIDRGAGLPGVRFGATHPVKKRSLRDGTIGSVFYTTSPFENGRRYWLADDGTIDATPEFGDRSGSFGTTLFQCAAALPQDIPFIQSLVVEAHLPALTLTALVNQYTPTPAKQKSSPRAKPYVSLKDDVAKAILALPDALPRETSRLLAIEMQRAKRLGNEAPRNLLLKLAAAVKAVEPTKQVQQLLAQLSSAEPDRATPQQIDTALRLLKGHTQRIGRLKLPFFDVVELHRTWPQDLVKALEEAEFLGLLSWSFHELSSGQMALLNLFSALAEALSQLAQRNVQAVALVIDEGEMFMHPSWQRKYLSDLTQFVGSYKERFKQIHLILSTHSLIVAGDAPPNRLYNVETGLMCNGFAYGPADVLKLVYGVKEFAGEYSEALYDKIIGFLRKDGKPRADAAVVRALVKQVASPRLKAYLQDELRRRS